MQDAAPEVTEVVVEGMTAPPEPKLLQIGRRPDEVPAENHNHDQGGNGAWVTLPNIGPPSSRPVSAAADGLAVLVCSVRGTLYAYRDACAACGTSLAQGSLDREILTCPACGAQYNVRLAGKGLGRDAALHLDPLPLLADSQGVRVAVPEGGGLVTGRPGFAGSSGPRLRPGAPSRSGRAPRTRAPRSRAARLRRRRAAAAAARGRLACRRPPFPRRRSRRWDCCRAGRRSRAGSPPRRRNAASCAPTEVAAEHGHMADLEGASLLCACRACYLLFTQPRPPAAAATGRCPTATSHDPGRG